MFHGTPSSKVGQVTKGRHVTIGRQFSNERQGSTERQLKRKPTSKGI